MRFVGRFGSVSGSAVPSLRSRSAAQITGLALMLLLVAPVVSAGPQGVVTSPETLAAIIEGDAMMFARAQHTATLLADGRVLLAGGIGTVGGAPIGIAEMIYPGDASSTWSMAMAVGRVHHTATLLRNGKVLIAGGTVANGSVTNLAEIFDPVLHTFSGTGSMNVARRKHTATLLPGGKVLFVGGDAGSNVPIASAELYDPATNQFTLAGSMAGARFDHTATLLRDGRVLVAGGSSGQYDTTNTAELYLPGSATFQMTDSMILRTGHSATLLPDGRVLICGGVSHQPSPNAIQPFSQRYDPATGLFDDPVAMWYFYHPTATLLPNGRVFVAGSGGGSASYQLYDPPTNTWTANYLLPLNTRDQTAVLLASGEVLLSGGLTGTNAVNNTLIYRTRGLGSFAGQDSMSAPRSRHTATVLPNRNVLLAGGTVTNTPAELFLFDSKTIVPTGTMSTARFYHSATLLPTGKVLIAGGYGPSNEQLSSAELYDPGTGSFTPTGSMSVPRWLHRASLLRNGKVLIVGGNDARSAEIYDPATGLFTQTVSPGFPSRFAPTATLQRTGVVLIAGGTQSASTKVEGFHDATGSYEGGAFMQIERSDHTATLLLDGSVWIVGGYGTNTVAEPEMFSSIFSNMLWPAWVARMQHTATALANGSVVVIGGRNGGDALNRADVFESLYNAYQDPSYMAIDRRDHTATALADGKVLVTGGQNDYDTSTNIVELYDDGAGIADARRPTISSFYPPVVCQPSSVTFTGTQFTGDSDGSSGGTNSSPGNVPILRLQRVDNEDMRYIGATSWSATSLTTKELDSYPSGHYRASVVVNGVPSFESLVHMTSGAPPTLGTYGNATVTHATSITVTPSAAPSFPGTFESLTAHASSGFTGALAVDRKTGVVTITNARPVGTFTISVYASTVCLTVIETFTLTVQPIGIPGNLIATAATASAINLVWTPVSGAASYQILRSSLNGPFTQVATSATNSYANTGLTGGRTYLYRVKAVDGGGLAGGESNTDLATTIVFTDDPAGRAVIRQVHLVQARSAVNAVRAAAGLAAFAFTDPTLTGVYVKAIHMQQLRSAVDQARTALGFPVTVKTYPATAGTIVRALDLEQVRAGVK